MFFLRSIFQCSKYICFQNLELNCCTLYRLRSKEVVSLKWFFIWKNALNFQILLKSKSNWNVQLSCKLINWNDTPNKPNNKKKKHLKEIEIQSRQNHTLLSTNKKKQPKNPPIKTKILYIQMYWFNNLTFYGNSAWVGGKVIRYIR